VRLGKLKCTYPAGFERIFAYFKQTYSDGGVRVFICFSREQRRRRFFLIFLTDRAMSYGLNEEKRSFRGVFLFSIWRIVPTTCPPRKEDFLGGRFYLFFITFRPLSRNYFRITSRSGCEAGIVSTVTIRPMTNI